MKTRKDFNNYDEFKAYLNSKGFKLELEHNLEMANELYKSYNEEGKRIRKERRKIIKQIIKENIERKFKKIQANKA